MISFACLTRFEADGFASAKAARAYIAKREGRPTVTWKRVAGQGYDGGKTFLLVVPIKMFATDSYCTQVVRSTPTNGFEHRLHFNGKHVATVELIDEGGPWRYTLVDAAGDDELDTLADAKEAAEEAAERH